MALVHNKKLINEPQDVVTEFIEGLTDTYPNLQYLNGFPEVKVVLRADVLSTPYDKVAVISGGGSGHEPAHAGFVGEGMLTAAICGNVFASPTVNSILAGIRAVTGPKGCLLIVKNYAGDRLKFGLAAEEAKSEGYKVEVVIVGDDCALPPPAPRRGLAGTILVHKIAGAAAAAGLALSDVAAEAKLASKMVGTMGIALYICTMPGHGDSERIRPGKMELGLGIHGESDGSVTEIQPVDVIVSLVLQQILSLVILDGTGQKGTFFNNLPSVYDSYHVSISDSTQTSTEETNYVSITRGSRVVLMVNGLGATSTMELMIAAGKAVSRLQMEHELAIDRVYTGSFMTSLDTSGFSISVMKVNERILQRLDAATKAPYWPVGAGTHLPAKIPVPLPQSRSTKSDELPRRPKQLNSGGRILEAAVQAAANAIINLRDSLNQWDGKVGDGGCGSHMLRGATAILEDIKKHYPLNDAAETVNEIGCSIRKAMGGTSGILYSIFCTAAYTALKADSNSAVTPEKWVDALQAAVTAYSKYGGAKTGNRTLLDALVPALSVLKEHLDAGDDPVAAFILSSEAAMAGAESTKLMKTQAWFLYVSPDALSSNPDPGAMAAATWFRAAALAVKGINTKV